MTGTRALALLLALGILAGCATARPEPPPPVEPPTLGGEVVDRTVEVFFGTDRHETSAADGHYSGARAADGGITYGACHVKIRPDTSLRAWLTRFIHPNRDLRPTFEMIGLTRLEPTAFFAELARRLYGRDDALLFIHGYNVTFADACARTAQLAYDLEFAGAPIMWSWPSNGHTADYFKDEADSEWSTGHLREFLVNVARQSRARRIHVIAHSMGTRLLTNTALRILGDPELRRQVRFSNLILAAPDIDRDVFVELMPVARHISETTTLYSSSADRALEASRLVHGYPRAGAVVPPVILTGVDSIDASGVDTSLLGLGHSYYAESRPVVADIRRIVRGEPPESRAPAIPLRRETAGGGLTYWVIEGAR